MTTTTSLKPTDIIEINENDYQWILNQDNTVTLTKFLGTVIPQIDINTSFPIASFNIPYILGGKIVTKIGPGAFQNNTVIDRIVIHNDIKSIEEGAFAGCTNLKYLSFYTDSKLETIKFDAFLNTNINAPIIPASVRSIENNAFNTQLLRMVTFNGNAPVFTASSFNSQSENGNYLNKITIIHYTNAIGFTNPDENKYTIVVNDKMIIPQATTEASTASNNTTTTNKIQRYIIYFLLFILFIVICYYIYRRFFSNNDDLDYIEEGDELPETPASPAAPAAPASAAPVAPK